MSDSKTKKYQEMFDIYEEMVGSIPEIERRGATMPYTALNGNMFSFLSKEGQISLRLSRPDRDLFLSIYDDSLSIQYGAVMKEYVELPDAVAKSPGKLNEYFCISYEYAKTLKPKATKRPKK
ncbi:hypothetical protein HQ531_13885 [bacterium]|nr:hypothetical protein [bacterium]